MIKLESEPSILSEELTIILFDCAFPVPSIILTSLPSVGELGIFTVIEAEEVSTINFLPIEAVYGVLFTST